MAGTKEDYATAIYVRDQIRSFGIPSELNEYDVLLNYPKAPAVVELITPKRRERLAAKESVIPEDVLLLISALFRSSTDTAPAAT